MGQAETCDTTSKPSKSGRHRSPARSDEVGVVEAAYRLDGTESEWLEGLARAAAPQLDQGLGIAAFAFELAPTRIRMRASAIRGGPAGLPDAVATMVNNADPGMLAGALGKGPCSMMSQAVGGSGQLEADPASRQLFDLGIRDGFAMLGVDPGGFSVGIAAYLPQYTLLSRRMASRWSRVASHLAAGFRVRRGLSAFHSQIGRPDPIAGSEAILTPSGRLHHAEGPAEHARQALACAVVAMERARGRLRAHDPDAALDAWKGLIAGRWSLVEHIDTDGKRFLVARKNDPHARGPAAVSQRERQILAARARCLSLKLIAYDLGLSVASVSRGLQTGMTKLGLSHETELAALFSLPAAASSR